MATGGGADGGSVVHSPCARARPVPHHNRDQEAFWTGAPLPMMALLLVIYSDACKLQVLEIYDISCQSEVTCIHGETLWRQTSVPAAIQRAASFESHITRGEGRGGEGAHPSW